MEYVIYNFVYLLLKKKKKKFVYCLIAIFSSYTHILLLTHFLNGLKIKS